MPNRCWKPGGEKDRKRDEERQGKQKDVKREERVMRIPERDERQKKRKLFYGAQRIEL